ncbi:MAG TPA: hypothetical protein VMA72_00895 [Streptosporangiaceae bacterium]|nr:hypothetical protein [Streptosporangiaceae bacterium]
MTGGSTTDAQMAAYAVASAPAPAPTGGANPYTTATLFEATPVSGQNPLTWGGDELSLKSTFPATSAPGGIGTTSNPVVANAADDTLADAVTAFPNTQTASGYTGLYDIRMEIGGIGTTATQAYYETAVSVNTTNNTWSVDYPDYTQNTTTTLTANPQNQSSSTPSPVTLTATVSPAAAGTVSFWNNSTTPATQVGTTQTVTATSGVATVQTTPPTGQTPYQAIFTPAVPDSPSGTGNTEASFDIGSQSPVVNTTVGPPPDSTATSLAEAGGGGPAGPVTFTGTVTDTTTPATTVTGGSVSLFDNGSSTPFVTTAVGAGGNFSTTFTYTSAGDHSVVATYSGTTSGSPEFAGSSSAPQTFAETAPACTTCNDVQTITGTVPAGTISISTPYTPANPLNLGTLALTPDGKYFTASASLDPNASDVPTAGQSPNSTFNGITVVDTQSGDLPWTVSALSSSLTDSPTPDAGGTISGENVGLTGLTPVFVPGNAIAAGDVSTFDQTAATPPVGPTDTGSLGLGGSTAHVIATDTAQPEGTVGINGTVTLNAPTSTEAGVFTGTITFTIAS